MKTGLTKKQKTTAIYFDEDSPIIEVITYNTDLKNRLSSFASQHPKECKLIAELKNTVADLTRKLAAATKELSEYKSVRNKLNAANVEQENERLRSRLRTYEDVISRNNLWSYFSRHRGKTPTKDEAR